MKPPLRARALRAAVDVGGTFTDVFVVDERSEVIVAKVPSTADPIDAVLAGIEKAGVDLADVMHFRHGTTVATNALITRELPVVGMITTRGFRDVLEIGSGAKELLWDHYDDKSPPYVARRNRLEVAERIDHEGRLLAGLAGEEAERAVRILRQRGVEAVAVCFINSYANPENELAMRDLLEREAPDVPVHLSSDVLPQIFEHLRFSTTVTNAVLGPLVTSYVRRLEDGLRAGGYAADLLILHSGGGMMTPASATRLPVRLAGSGIAAGAIASQHFASMCGFDNAIGLDMGGTSSDVSLVHNGQLQTTNEWGVEFDHPIALPSIAVVTIGAGGGSLATIDDGGALHSGPQSAGARPGPVCYGLGGDAPTTTDANLVLGRLPDDLVGGALRLDRHAAEESIRKRIAEPLGLDPVAAAKAIVDVANANMADAVRLISVRRGLDPRDFALVAFGGGGPLHAVAVARDLSIPQVIIPPHPGITSALGCLLVDIRHDLTRMLLADVDDRDQHCEVLTEAFSDLEQEGRARLAAEGLDPDEIELRRSIDVRYAGQWRSLSLVIPDEGITATTLTEAFHTAHEREHAYRRHDTPIEIFRVSVQAIGRTSRPSLASASVRMHSARPAHTRLVHFDESECASPTGIYDRDALEPGAQIYGPAIVNQLDSTTLVPPSVVARVDAFYNLRIELEL